MKWDCEIIQDLIPSYVDEVCSDKSKEAVEEHMRECNKCKNVAEQYRLIDFSADMLGEKELDGLKMIRRKMHRQRLVSAGLAVLLILLGIQAFWGDGYITEGVHYALLPLCIVGMYLTRAPEGGTSGRVGDHLLAAGSVAAIVVSVGMMFVALSQAMSGESVLGVEPEKAGPLLAAIWAFGFTVQLVLLFVLLYRQCTLHVENRARACICVTGMFLLLVYVEAMRWLDSIEMVWMRFVKMSVTILALGLLGTLINHFLSRD